VSKSSDNLHDVCSQKYKNPSAVILTRQSPAYNVSTRKLLKVSGGLAHTRQKCDDEIDKEQLRFDDANVDSFYATRSLQRDQ